MNYEGRATYTQSLSSVNLRGVLGTNYMNKTTSNSYAGTSGGLSLPGFYNLDASVDRPSVSTAVGERAISSVFSQLAVDYGGFLFADFTAVYGSGNYEFGSESDGTHADKTSLIRFGMAQSKAKVEQTIMVGDRHYDIIGAQNNGLRSVGVTYGYGGQQELEKAGATKIISRPTDLANAARTLL